jgi:hypothetical protein
MQKTTITTSKTILATAAVIAAIGLGASIAITANASPAVQMALPSAAEMNARLEAAAPVITGESGPVVTTAQSAEVVIKEAVSLYLRSEGIADESARAALLEAINGGKQYVEDAHVLSLRILWALERYNNERADLDQFGLSDMTSQFERLVTATAEFEAFDSSAIDTASAAVVTSLTDALPESDPAINPATRIEQLAFSLPFVVEQVVTSDNCGLTADAWGCYDPSDGGGVIRLTSAGLALSDADLRAVIAHEQRHHQQLEASVYRYSGTELENREWIEGDAYPFGDLYRY